MAEKKTAKMNISDHILVPKHTKLSEKEKNELLAKYKITLTELPKISMSDAAIKHMDLTSKDVIKIIRKSPTTTEAIFYRRVVK